MSTTAATAAVRLSPARATKAASSPWASIRLGSVSEATAPPSGSAIWRMPRAKPRSVRANQPITARPDAPVALEPNMPATSRATRRAA